MCVSVCECVCARGVCVCMCVGVVGTVFWLNSIYTYSICDRRKNNIKAAWKCLCIHYSQVMSNDTTCSNMDFCSVFIEDQRYLKLCIGEAINYCTILMSSLQ